MSQYVLRDISHCPSTSSHLRIRAPSHAHPSWMGTLGTPLNSTVLHPTESLKDGKVSQGCLTGMRDRGEVLGFYLLHCALHTGVCTQGGYDNISICYLQFYMRIARKYQGFSRGRRKD